MGQRSTMVPAPSTEDGLTPERMKSDDRRRPSTTTFARVAHHRCLRIMPHEIPMIAHHCVHRGNALSVHAAARRYYVNVIFLKQKNMQADKSNFYASVRVNSSLK